MLTRHITEPREVDGGDDIMMDGQTGNKKLAKEHTQLDIGVSLDGYEPGGECPDV